LSFGKMHLLLKLALSKIKVLIFLSESWVSALNVPS